MHPIIANIEAAIARATAPVYLDEHPLLSGYCPHCGSDLILRSIPQHPADKDTWNAQRFYFGVCNGANHERLPLNKARKLKCWDDERVTEYRETLDAAQEDCTFDRWRAETPTVKGEDEADRRYEERKDYALCE